MKLVRWGRGQNSLKKRNSTFVDTSILEDLSPRTLKSQRIITQVGQEWMQGTILHGLPFLHIMGTEFLTAFIVDYLFKQAYTAKSLGKQRLSPSEVGLPILLADIFFFRVKGRRAWVSIIKDSSSLSLGSSPTAQPTVYAGIMRPSSRHTLGIGTWGTNVSKCCYFSSCFCC